jgi:holin-like protein
MKKVLGFIRGLAIVVICYYGGELLSLLINGFISPAVMGMMLLFVLLQLKVFKSSQIDKSAEFLLDNLVFFFIPATAGVALIPFAIIKQDAITIIISSVLSTLFVLISAGLIIEKFEKRDEKRRNT